MNTLKRKITLWNINLLNENVRGKSELNCIVAIRLDDYG